MPSLRFRQIHLDFHTSEAISPIAEDFEPEAFAKTLADAHVNSVTCFSRCHHGLIYHDTQFQARHPGLSRNLLAEQIEACHQRDINVPVYITVGWDEFQAARHPEWLERGVDGVAGGAGPLQPRWKKLCLNSPYVDYVSAQTREVLEGFDADGLFFDIILQGPCVCGFCLGGMAEAGLDPESEADHRAYAARVVSRFRRRMSDEVRALRAGCPIFYNAGHVGPHTRPDLGAYSHLELESLPSGGWGYDHFPLTVRYARTLGLETMGMTGKFHKSWADFGGFKSPAALEYECFMALAEGARCSVGDQLHPRGALDPATYELIGPVYKSVAEKEPWCEGAEPVTEIAVFTPEAIGKEDDRVDSAVNGALRMLLESHHQFDVVDADSDWSGYQVLILPDKITLDEALAAQVDAFVRDGNALLLSHLSGADRATEREFVLESMPGHLEGPARHSPDYIVARETLAAGIPATQHVMYERGLEVTPVEGAEVLADVWWPYFDRTWDHFCSHAQTPADKPGEFPAVVQHGRVIYCAHPLFGMYLRHGAPAYKRLILNALGRLLPEPLVVSNAPSTAHITLLRQPAHDRTVLHLLHYIPERRCKAIDTIEDVIPLHNIEVGARIAAPREAYLAPGRQSLSFEERDNRICVTIPEFHGHAMVIFES